MSDGRAGKRPMQQKVAEAQGVHPWAPNRVRAAEWRRQNKRHAAGIMGRIIQLAMQDEDRGVAIKACQEFANRYWGKPETATSEEAGALLIEALQLVRDRSRMDAAIDVTPGVSINVPGADTES